MSSWIPSLRDVQEKLEAGARVADVGCGKGASTLLMAKAFPKSRFFGFDYHDKSIEAARESADVTAFPTASFSLFPKQKSFPAQITTLSQYSIACMTWEIRSVPHRTFDSPWRKTARG